MTLCETCITLTIDELVDNDVLFQPDLATLKGSAERGCNFCALCWTALQTVNQSQLDRLLRGDSAWDEGQEWTPTIHLRGSHFWGGGTAGTRIDVSCGKLASMVSGNAREANRNPPPSVAGWLEVYELPGQPSKYNLRGRLTTISHNPDLHVHLTRQWLRNCEKTHKACAATRGGQMPTRVLDIGISSPSATAPRVRLITTNGMKEPYIALSYCWGADTSGVFTLHAKTQSLLLDDGINASELSRSHRDVISLARDLGFRYLWIDALCIIQGDAADWDRESVTMARVYGNAALTVVAGRSASQKDGFIVNMLGEDSHMPPPCELPVDRVPGSGSLMVALRRSDNMGPVSGRGWCFQERMISRRAVVFGEQQLSFQCATGFFFENGEERPNRVRPKFLQQPELSCIPTSVNGAKRVVLTRAEETLKEWYQILFQFTQCSLSNPHDMFAAITAIAQEASRVLDCRYLAGIWECDVVRGLLWRPCYHFQIGPASKIATTRPKSTSLTREKSGESIIRSPSWSWAAVQGPVAHVMWSPLLVARFRDPSYSMIRPRHRSPEQGTEPSKTIRWSLDNRACGVEVLHMPQYELHLTGRIARAKVLEEPVIDYLALKKGWRKFPKGKAAIHGALLARSRESHDKDETWDHIVGIGFFDVGGEREGVDEVWCLPVGRDLGLILSRYSDGKFGRLGWFVLESESWFLAQKEGDVCLC